MRQRMKSLARLSILSAVTLGAGGTWSHGATGSAAWSSAQAGDSSPFEATVSDWQKVQAYRAALVDAQRLLAERVLGIRITADQTVEDFVLVERTVQSSVEGLIRGARLQGEPRMFSDGTCEVDMVITLEQVVTQVDRIAEEVVVAGRVERQEWEDVSRFIEREDIEVMGEGVALPMEMDDEWRLVDAQPRFRIGTDGKPIGLAEQLPEVWRKSPRARLTARRAAERDAQVQMASRVEGVLVTSLSFESSEGMADRVRTYLSTHLRGMRSERDPAIYRPDGIVLYTITLPVEQVVEVIDRVMEEVRDGQTLSRQEIVEIERFTERRVLTAVGMAPIGRQRLDVEDGRGAAETGVERRSNLGRLREHQRIVYRSPVRQVDFDRAQLEVALDVNLSIKAQGDPE